VSDVERAVDGAVEARLVAPGPAERDEGPIAECDPVQVPRDPDEPAHAAQDQRGAEVRHRADLAKRALDLDEAGCRPAEPPPQELV
jgi:hypothetical protein